MRALPPVPGPVDDAVVALAHRVTALSEAVDRVRALHSQRGIYGRWCPACGDSVPCATIRALGPVEGG